MSAGVVKTNSSRAPRAAAAAAFVGSMVEYYDFFIYGAASALVFGKVFFPEVSPTAGTLAALSTFAVAYIARPVGSFFVGHFGDRIGRKSLLVFTLLLMGVCTTLIGCLPDFNTIGIAAPIILVFLRFLQGLSAAGEQSGSTALSLEHAPANRRGWFGSFTMSGTFAGIGIATLIFIPISALPDDALFSWGWRLPFLASAVLIVVGLIVRLQLSEAPAFDALKGHGQVARIPALDFVRHNKIAFVRVIFAYLFACVNTIITTFVPAYAVSNFGYSRPAILTVIGIANLCAVVTIPLWCRLSDRWGRRPVFMLGSFGCAASLFIYFPALTSGSLLLFIPASLLMTTCFYAAVTGVMPIFIAEMFATRIRFTGSSVSSQFGNIPSGFAPAIAASIVGVGVLGWLPVAIVFAIGLVLSGLAAASSPETAFSPLDELGSPADRAANVNSTAPVAPGVPS